MISINTISRSERIRTLHKTISLISKSLRKNTNSIQIQNRSDVRECFHAGINSKRLVLFLKGSGCSHAARTGGCTFCGFYAATNLGKQISGDESLFELQSLLLQSDPQKNYPVLSLYNDGSMLDDREMEFEDVIRLLDFAYSYGSYKKIIIEAKVSDLQDEKIQILGKRYPEKIEIAFGFESASPLIRRICINKSFANNKLRNIVKISQESGVCLTALIFFHPPFLTVGESIQDIVDSIHFLYELGINHCDLELPTVEKNTLVYELWKSGLYEPVSLWALPKLLENLPEHFWKMIYISPWIYSVPGIAFPRHCPDCLPVLENFINQFNQTKILGKIPKTNCQCSSEMEDIEIRRAEPENILHKAEKSVSFLRKNSPETFQ